MGAVSGRQSAQRPPRPLSPAATTRTHTRTHTRTPPPPPPPPPWPPGAPGHLVLAKDLREAEVAEFHVAVGHHEDVLRLEVAVQHADAVQLPQRQADLHEAARDEVQRQRPEGLALLRGLDPVAQHACDETTGWGDT